MAELANRDLHQVKKVLVIAVLTIKANPGPFQSEFDMSHMKELLDRVIESNVKLEHYARSAQIAVTGWAE